MTIFVIVYVVGYAAYLPLCWKDQRPKGSSCGKTDFAMNVLMVFFSASLSWFGVGCWAIYDYCER